MGRLARAVTGARLHPATKARKKLATVVPMSESLVVTIVYEQGEEGWVVASLPEVPGAHSQGRTREEARANVIDALRGILELRFGKHPQLLEGTDSEPLELVIGALSAEISSDTCVLMARDCCARAATTASGASTPNARRLPASPRDRLPARAQDLRRPRHPTARRSR